MRKKHEDLEPELRMYAVQEHEIRKQLIPPIIFFAAIGLIILISLVKRHQKIEAGGMDMTSNAILVDYMTAAVGLQIYENTDELDKSYGDYFYLGPDFYEVGERNAMILFDHKGYVVYDGVDQVTTFYWECYYDSVDQEEVESMAEELITAYGSYEKDDSGVYWWYADSDGTLGENENLAWISCGLNERGNLAIQGGAE